MWKGDADKAYTAALPVQSPLQSSGYASVHAYLKVNANYQLVIDNLLDLTHGVYLHKQTLAGDVPVDLRHEFSASDGAVHSNYYVDKFPPPPMFASLFPDPLAHFRAEMTWYPASILELSVKLTPLAAGTATTLHAPSSHYLTPETDVTTHYFAATARNVKIDDPQEDEIMYRFLMQAFVDEDEPMIAACQELMEGADLFSLHPAILKTDIAAVQARRTLSNLIKAESGSIQEPA